MLFSIRFATSLLSFSLSCCSLLYFAYQAHSNVAEHKEQKKEIVEQERHEQIVYGCVCVLLLIFVVVVVATVAKEAGGAATRK